MNILSPIILPVCKEYATVICILMTLRIICVVLETFVLKFILFPYEGTYLAILNWCLFPLDCVKVKVLQRISDKGIFSFFFCHYSVSRMRQSPLRKVECLRIYYAIPTPVTRVVTLPVLHLFKFSGT